MRPAGRGLKTPALGKGQRYIIVHAGSSEGFILNGLLYFRSKSTKDYHEEMEGASNVPQNSIIVMDNAPLSVCSTEQGSNIFKFKRRNANLATGE